MLKDISGYVLFSSDGYGLALVFLLCVSVPVVAAGAKIPSAVPVLIFVSLLLYFRFNEITMKSNVEYHAGGSTQNSVKIAQVSLCLPCLCIHWFTRNSRFVRLAALGIESIAAQHVDTLQL